MRTVYTNESTPQMEGLDLNKQNSFQKDEKTITQALYGFITRIKYMVEHAGAELITP
ncbi:hypothetical protein [Sinomicrobium sp. M5D2P9]